MVDDATDVDALGGEFTPPLTHVVVLDVAMMESSFCGGGLIGQAREGRDSQISARMCIKGECIIAKHTKVKATLDDVKPPGSSFLFIRAPESEQKFEQVYVEPAVSMEVLSEF